MKFRKILSGAAVAVLLQAVILPASLLAQDAKQAEVYAAIRKEGLSENSKIMHLLHNFTDLYGPRMTGSPNHVEAARFGTREMLSWGFDRAFLEPWEFGRPGWVNERAVGLITKPVQDTLAFEVLAWSPSTKGVITADAVHLVVPQFPSSTNPNVMQNPTQEELNAFFNSVKADINGKIVLVGRHAFLNQTLTPLPKRLDDETLKRQFDPSVEPTPAPSPQQQANRITPRANALQSADMFRQIDKFLLENNVQLRINDAGMNLGLMRAFNATFPNREITDYDPTKVVPTVVLRNEDFGRITRLLARKHQVRLEFDIRNRLVPDGVTSYNMIGEIDGSDKKDQVIMLGGHLDGWHAGTGATDNAVGCATMMEAARILKAIGVKPRRTVRVACWSGEEQGLLGSKAYVKKHFGTAEKPTAEWSKFGGYFNIDSGTGKVRALTVFGPSQTASVLREALAPFSDLGFAGIRSTRSRATGGSDHTSFNEAGLPGIGSLQDPIEYGSTTWHTNLDNYERIIEADVRTSAVIFAAAVYALAMRDELLPKFSAADMPAAPQASASPTPAASPAPTARP